MNIETIPENYTGALVPVIYRIGQAAPEEVITVQIITGPQGQTAGEKRLAGENLYMVNVANYCKGRISVEPVAGQWAGVGHAERRCCLVKIKAGDTTSPEVYVTGGKTVCPVKKILSGSPAKQRIAPGEKDEIAIIAPGTAISAKATLNGLGGTAEVELGSAECGNGVYVAVIDTGQIEAMLGKPLCEFTEMTVEIGEAGNTLDKREYRIVPPAGRTVRLCWQNPYGQVDYHTFDLVGEELNVSKNRAYLNSGYTTTGMAEEVVTRVVSQCEPRKTFEWLTGILSAPQVWVATRNGAVKVDVLTDSAVSSSRQPGSISLSFRRTAARTNL